MTMASGLQVYLHQIKDTPLLTPERERALARRLIRDNDRAARDEMVRSNLRLVVNLVRNYSRRGISSQDLIAEGNLGLLRAVEAFNPELNIRFSTYAAWWIKQSIRRALVNAVQTVHIPNYMVNMIARGRRAVAEFEDQLGRQPRPEELAHRLQISLRKVRTLRRAGRVLRASQPAPADADRAPALHETLADERTLTPENIVLGRDQVRALTGLLNTIDPRHAKILRLRFGFNDHPPLTLKQIGTQLGLTRERVRQIEAEALQLLHTRLSADRLPAFSHAR